MTLSELWYWGKQPLYLTSHACSVHIANKSWFISWYSTTKWLEFLKRFLLYVTKIAYALVRTTRSRHWRSSVRICVGSPSVHLFGFIIYYFITYHILKYTHLLSLIREMKSGRMDIPPWWTNIIAVPKKSWLISWYCNYYQYHCCARSDQKVSRERFKTSTPFCVNRQVIPKDTFLLYPSYHGLTDINLYKTE